MVLRKYVILLWILGIALAVSHLLFLADYKLASGFWVYSCGLLVCYSLPFLALTILRIPEARSAQRYILLTLFVLVIATSLFIPVRRFLPGYHPAALEALTYLFLPFYELGVIVLFVLVGGATALLSKRRPTP